VVGFDRYFSVISYYFVNIGEYLMINLFCWWLASL